MKIFIHNYLYISYYISAIIKIFTLILWGVARITISVRGVAWYKRLKTPDLNGILLVLQFIARDYSIVITCRSPRFQNSRLTGIIAV